MNIFLRISKHSCFSYPNLSNFSTKNNIFRVEIYFSRGKKNNNHLPKGDETEDICQETKTKA